MPRNLHALNTHFASALVTGASSGLGREIAMAFLQEGLTVYGTSRNPQQKDLPQNIIWIPFEGASANGLNRFLQDHGELLSKIDILVNNSGSSLFGRGIDIPPEAFEEEHQLLYKTAVSLTNASYRGMRERGRGGIVNVSSLAAIFPMPYMAGYSAGKAALSAYTRSLILTESDNGVIFLDFQPGDLKTAFNAHIRRFDTGSARERAAWERIEENMHKSPSAKLAARDLIRALKRGRSGTVRTGGFFQARIAPLGLRLLSSRLQLAAIRRYYDLSG